MNDEVKSVSFKELAKAEYTATVVEKATTEHRNAMKMAHDEAQTILELLHSYARNEGETDDPGRIQLESLIASAVKGTRKDGQRIRGTVTVGEGDDEVVLTRTNIEGMQNHPAVVTTCKHCQAKLVQPIGTFGLDSIGTGLRWEDTDMHGPGVGCPKQAALAPPGSKPERSSVEVRVLAFADALRDLIEEADNLAN
jgi:hypothetical protein